MGFMAPPSRPLGPDPFGSSGAAKKTDGFKTFGEQASLPDGFVSQEKHLCPVVEQQKVDSLKRFGKRGLPGGRFLSQERLLSPVVQMKNAMLAAKTTTMSPSNKSGCNGLPTVLGRDEMASPVRNEGDDDTNNVKGFGSRNLPDGSASQDQFLSPIVKRKSGLQRLLFRV
jgi:hypothetical protein